MRRSRSVRRGVHEAEARRRRGDKDLPVRQGVDASGRVGGAIGHAPFVAEAAPIPREKETSTLWVVVTPPVANSVWPSRDHATLVKSVWRLASTSAGLCPPTRSRVVPSRTSTAATSL